MLASRTNIAIRDRVLPGAWGAKVRRDDFESAGKVGNVGAAFSQ